MVNKTVIMIGLVGALAFAGIADGNDVRSLKATDARMNQAASNRDLDRYCSFIHGSYLTRDPEGRSAGKAEYRQHLRGVFSQPWQIHRLSTSAISAEVVGSTGIVTGVAELKLKMKGRPEEVQRYGYTRTFIWQGGRWMLLSGMSRPLPPR